MDTDFVNKYIQKQSQLINELMSKNLMVEVKLQQLEEQYNALIVQHQALVEGVERARKAAEEQTACVSMEQKTSKKQTQATKRPPASDFVDGNQQLESQF